MLNRYREILSLPGAWQFAVAGVLARSPMSIVGISFILAIRALYGSYSLAGLISAVGVISFAIGAPILARLVDRFGQAKVMLPAVMISATALLLAIIGILNVIPPAYLMVLASINGAASGSLGALVRARWTHVTENATQLQAAYAMEAAFDELVFIMGPVLATLISASIHPTAGLWMGLFFMVFGGLVFLLQTSTEPPLTPHVHGQKRESVMRNPAMIVLALTFVGTGALFGASDLSVVAFADEVNMSYLAGTILGSMALGSLVSAVIYGSRAWMTPLWKLFLIFIGLFAVGTTTFVFAPNLAVLAFFMFLAGLAISPTMTSGNTIVQRIVPPSRLTEGLTWMATASTIGISLGSAVTGPVIDTYGHTGGFLIVVVFAWLMFLTALIGSRSMRAAIEKADAEHSINDLWKNTNFDEFTSSSGTDSASSPSPTGLPTPASPSGLPAPASSPTPASQSGLPSPASQSSHFDKPEDAAD